LFDASRVTLTGLLRATLADPERPTAATGAESKAVVRPQAARAAGCRVEFLELRRSGTGGTDIVSPIRGVVRRVKLDPAAALPGGIVDVAEIAPLPFELASMDTLRTLRAGLPLFYVAPIASSVVDDTVIEAGAVVASIATGASAFAGALFQDNVAVGPSTWLSMIGRAMLDQGENAVGWLAQLDVLGAQPSVRVTDHAGIPLVGAPFTVEVRQQSTDTVVSSAAVTLGADADLETAIAAAQGAPIASLFEPPPGHFVSVRWGGMASPGDEALPTHAIYETGAHAAPGQHLAIPARESAPWMNRYLLQVLDLSRWFPLQRAGVNVARYHTNSHLEPLIDGIDSLRRLQDDLTYIATAGGAAQFMGWAFIDLVCDPVASDDTFTEIVARLLDQSREVRILANRLITLANENLPNTRAIAVLIAGCLSNLIFVGTLAAQLDTDNGVAFAWMALPALSLMVTSLFDLEAAIERAFEDSKPVVDAVNAASGSRTIAVFSSNPVRVIDNPLAEHFDPSDPLFGIEEDIVGPGNYHGKAQLVDRGGTDRPGVVAYLGGIDINKNRLDSPGHRRGGLHDVQARLRGPVVADVVTTFNERWQHERAGHPGIPDAAIPTPPAGMPAPVFADGEEAHLCRVARTYPKLSAQPAPDILPFAPDGDDGIYRTLLAAIESARDFIYIEDQYFTPDDAFVDALLAARDRCKRLLILVPSEADQPFGDVRRRDLFARLRGTASEPGWGDRLLVGFPQRAPVMPSPGPSASKGRAWLASPCDIGGVAGSTIDVAPRVRVPGKAPFWLWINGELMLATRVTPGVANGIPIARVDVVRGSAPGDPRWAAHPRAHLVDSPVSVAPVAAIYVHSKCMIVDDTFVSIGSANLNRRGFFHDGELNSFAIPARLQAAVDNPARRLRAQLWAEQLGLPPSMGPTLLHDPVAGFDLFFRPHFAGNRFTPFAATNIRPLVPVEVSIDPTAIATFSTILQFLLALGGGAVQLFHERLWNLLSDPTTALDPNPQAGPV
jgi:phosphatidylserine/phosphatidylglycerophosphate/cardiolipin synthase-like enzyme